MEIKIGDIVKHKVMRGFFCVVRDLKGPNFGVTSTPSPDYEIRDEAGQLHRIYECEIKNIVPQ